MGSWNTGPQYAGQMMDKNNFFSKEATAAREKKEAERLKKWSEENSEVEEESTQETPEKETEAVTQSSPESTKKPELIDISGIETGAFLEKILKERPEVAEQIKEIGRKEKSVSTKVEKVKNLLTSKAEKFAKYLTGPDGGRDTIATILGGVIGALSPSFVLSFLQHHHSSGDMFGTYFRVDNDYSWVDKFTHFESGTLGSGELINGEIAAVFAVLGAAAAIVAFKKIQSGEIPIKDGLEQLAKASGNKLIKLGQLFKGDQI